ncbi:MAG: RICIN domain-containing protein [Pseudomonadota bacterium]
MLRQFKTQCLGLATIGLTVGCANVATLPEQNASLTDQDGYEGRVRLVRFLDEPDGYCLDVPGPAGSELLEVPLVAHTCHPDPYLDQVFRFNQDRAREIRWTTEAHDLCFTPDAVEVGSRLHLRTCGEHPAQAFEYTIGQELKLVDANLCIQVERRGAGPRQPPGEGQDAYGRGLSVNAQYTHLMRFLELRQCGDGDPSMSRWKAIQ